MLRWNLCCVSNRLAADGHKFETMTYKRFASLPRDEAVAVLSARTLNNIRVTSKILEQCADNNWGYRVSSSLFPLLTYDTAGLDLESYPDRIEIMETLVGCSNIVRKKNIRISCHPDQFNVLASEGQKQVRRTITELNQHGWLMDVLGGHRNYLTPINIHVNCTKGAPRDIAARFMRNLSKCDDAVRSRLVVENEDRGIWTPKLLAQHFDLPITYDNLHHKCLPDGFTESKAASICYQKWKRNGCDIPIFHYSESHPDKSNPRTHAEMPTSKPNDYGFSMPVDYDIELKQKDFAIAALD